MGRQTAVFQVEIPCFKAMRKCAVEAGVIDGQLPLLVSEKALKRINFKLNTATDTAQNFGCSLSLRTTISGHYLMPLLTSSGKTNAVSTAFVNPKAKSLSRRWN